MMSALKTVNILVTLDENYLPHLNVMLSTLIRFNPDCVFDIYRLHTSIGQDALKPTETILGNSGRLIPIQACDLKLDHAPTTPRYPKEIYYRIFAARFLPDTLDTLDQTRRVLSLPPVLSSPMPTVRWTRKM